MGNIHEREPSYCKPCRCDHASMLNAGLNMTDMPCLRHSIQTLLYVYRLHTRLVYQQKTGSCTVVYTDSSPREAALTLQERFLRTPPLFIPLLMCECVSHHQTLHHLWCITYPYINSQQWSDKCPPTFV